MRSLPPLQPGEQVLHEERSALPGAGMLVVAVLLALLALLVIGSSPMGGVALILGAAALVWLRQRATKDNAPVVRVTDRRVSALTASGIDEIQLSKVEIVRTDGDGVSLIGAGGVEFRIRTVDPSRLRGVIQAAIAD